MTTFGESFTVAQIKAKAGSSSFNVYKNPDPAKNGAMSWKCGTMRGPVSRNGYGSNPVITEITNDAGSMALVLHEQGATIQTDANRVDSL